MHPEYSSEHAQMYDSLGIGGTTYEIGFDGVRSALGSLNGQEYLDFGSGAGRSAQFLRALGAQRVYGVDHDRNMVELATSKHLSGVEFRHADGTIPLPDRSVDGAISVNVFIEIRTRETMRSVCAEIARVLKPGGVFVLMSTNPGAFGQTFRSFSYSSPSTPTGGSLAICTVATANGPLRIEDTYWTEADYRTAISGADLRILDVDYPRPARPEEWSTAEATVAPFVIFRSVRPEHYSARMPG